MELASELMRALVAHPWNDGLMWAWSNAMAKRCPRVISRKEFNEILDYLHRRYWIFYKEGKLTVFRQSWQMPQKELLRKNGWYEI